MHAATVWLMSHAGDASPPGELHTKTIALTLGSFSARSNASRTPRGSSWPPLAISPEKSITATEGAQAEPDESSTTALVATEAMSDPAPPTSMDPAKAQLPRLSTRTPTSTQSTMMGALLRLGA